jgi:hypothetical protein
VAEREQVALIAAYGAAGQDLRASVADLVALYWADLPGWRDDDLARWLQVIVPLVTGGQLQMAQMTAAYLSDLLGDMLGEQVDPAFVDVDQLAAIRGVDPEVEWARPFVTVRTALAAGKTLDQASAEGLHRAQQLAATDVQLARTHTARAALADDDRVVGYRRVLVSEENCGLCVIASTQRYRRGDLMPLHAMCDCAIAPIVGDEDPGQVIDQELLDAARDAIDAQFGDAAADIQSGADLRKLVLVREHGEMGPVLTVASHEFTSAESLDI